MVRHSARSQPSGLLGRPGYCRTTGGEEQKGCVPEQEQGWFSGTFVRIDQCLQSCVTCNTCHYATFSKRMNDCSWYAAARCNLQRLQTAAEGQHRSYRVRHFNGSVLSTVTARLARRAAAAHTTTAHTTLHTFCFRCWFSSLISFLCVCRSFDVC